MNRMSSKVLSSPSVARPTSRVTTQRNTKTTSARTTISTALLSGARTVRKETVRAGPAVLEQAHGPVTQGSPSRLTGESCSSTNRAPVGRKGQDELVARPGLPDGLGVALVVEHVEVGVLIARSISGGAARSCSRPAMAGPPRCARLVRPSRQAAHAVVVAHDREPVPENPVSPATTRTTSSAVATSRDDGPTRGRPSDPGRRRAFRSS